MIRTIKFSQFAGLILWSSYSFANAPKLEDKVTGIWLYCNYTGSVFTYAKIPADLRGRHRFKFKDDGTLTVYAASPTGKCGTVPFNFYDGNKGTWKVTSDSTLSVSYESGWGMYEENWVIITITADSMKVKVRDEKAIDFSKNVVYHYSWRDSSFTTVHLQDTVPDRKVFAVKAGQKAIIYVKAKLIKQWILENSNDISKSELSFELSSIIKTIDNVSRYSDTIPVEPTWHYFKYIVAEELKNGNASVYYNKMKSFVSTISHRIERYERVGYHYFYLPDSRPFFNVTEFTAITENYKRLQMGEGMKELRAKLESMNSE